MVPATYNTADASSVQSFIRSVTRDSTTGCPANCADQNSTPSGVTRLQQQAEGSTRTGDGSPSKRIIWNECE